MVNNCTPAVNCATGTIFLLHFFKEAIIAQVVNLVKGVTTFFIISLIFYTAPCDP